MAEYNPSKIIKDGNTYNFRDTTKIPLAGSNQISGDLVPSTDGTVNLGSVSYQWNNAYIKSLTINGVACGNILTHNVSEFVKVTDSQTIEGNKTFTGFTVLNPYRFQIKSSSQEIGVIPSTNQWNGITFTDKNNLSTFSIEQAFFSNGNAMLHFSMTPNIAGGSLLRIFESIYLASANEIVTKSRTLIPDANNSRNLGSSSNKWKSLNGINPGALSLPGTGVIDVSSNITALDGTTQNKFTPQINGWLHINGTGPMSDGFIYAVQGRIGMKSANNPSYGRCAVLIPVVAGVELSVTCKLSTLTWANITPCQGNV